jgi:hypothetical protein
MAFEWLPTGSLGKVFVLSYNREVDSFSLLYQSNQLYSFNVSPDGRWVAAVFLESEPPSNIWRLAVEAVGGGESRSILLQNGADPASPPRYDWSAGSDWLLILHQGLLTLYDAGTGQPQPAVPSIPGCVQAAWLN